MNERTSRQNVQQVKIRHVEDALGFIGFVENPDIPFKIQRVYFLSNIPANTVRGRHGHKRLQQVFIALSGSFNIRVVSQTGDEIFKLSTASEGLYIPANCWRELSNFTSDAICLVLASSEYDKSDYFYDLAEFMNPENRNISESHEK